MMASFDKDVECILAERMTSRRGVPAYKEYFFLKWGGLPEREASSERADELWQFEDQIRRFIEEGSTRFGTLSAARESKKKLLSAPTREIRCAL